MTFAKAWEQLENKYPALRDPDSVVTFKVRNLKALLQQIHTQGRKSAEQPKGAGANLLKQLLKGRW